MKIPAFFQRKTFWLPTLPGLILLFVALAALSYFTFKHVAEFLSINEPVGSDYLVVEGWLNPERLRQAKQVFDEGNYQMLIVSGGPITSDFYGQDKNFAVRAGKFLISIGAVETRLAVVPAPHSAQDRTFLSAVMVREWFVKNNISVTVLDVFSGDVHSRRTRDLYTLAFKDVRVGIYSSPSTEYDQSFWWKTSVGAKAVVAELAGWLMVSCCFDPGEEGSHWEKWGVEKEYLSPLNNE